MGATAEALAQGFCSRVCRHACMSLMGELSSLATSTQNVLPEMQLPCNWESLNITNMHY